MGLVDLRIDLTESENVILGVSFLPTGKGTFFFFFVVKWSEVINDGMFSMVGKLFLNTFGNVNLFVPFFRVV